MSEQNEKSNETKHETDDKIRIVIADDHPIVRDALRNLIVGNHMMVVGEAENGAEVLACLDKMECDLLILDMSMPGHPIGPELVKMIIAKEKNAPPILIFSMSNDGRIALSALQAGASGYITKDTDPTHIMEAIHKVVAGSKYICPTIAEQILLGQEKESSGQPPHKALTRREYQIFLLLLDGKSMEEIASELCISRQTVGTHKMRLMHKLGLQGNVDIVRYAVRHGLISL